MQPRLCSCRKRKKNGTLATKQKDNARAMDWATRLHPLSPLSTQARVQWGQEAAAGLGGAADPEPSPPELRGPARHLLREAGCYSLCVHRAQRLQAHGSAPRLHCWPPHQVSSQTLLIPARFSDAECLLLAVPPVHPETARLAPNDNLCQTIHMWFSASVYSNVPSVTCVCTPPRFAPTISWSGFMVKEQVCWKLF